MPVEHLCWQDAQRCCEQLFQLPAEQAAGRHYFGEAIDSASPSDAARPTAEGGQRKDGGETFLLAVASCAVRINL